MNPSGLRLVVDGMASLPFCANAEFMTAEGLITYPYVNGVDVLFLLHYLYSYIHA